MESAASTHILLEDTARRQRAKERLYVLCQAIGWSAFLAMQIVYSFFFSINDNHGREPWLVYSIAVLIAALGVLLTHFARPLIEKWNWKQIDWRSLMPRVLGLGAGLGLIWMVGTFGYLYGILHLPWPHSNFSLPAGLAISWVNCACMMDAWLFLYFFYHLFDRFNRSEIERLRLATTVKESELRALKSQVNPHFIFNSLNSLRALIDEDPARARQSVTRLSNLLRYSLQSSHLEAVPFENELQIVNDYLALEQVRHEERLRVRLDVAPETLTMPVPPMLLQTLVENAVKYGIAPRPEGGEIAIIARCRGGALSIRVTNPGRLDAAVTPAQAASTGVGLRNAADRLRLLFGERATLQLRAEAPALVVAEAILPLQVARD